jgi:ABC-2 type transport system permease protein
VALVLIRLKLAVLRHSAAGDQAAGLVSGATLGLLLAAGTIWLAVVAPPLLPVALAAWTLGWVFGPAFLGGGETLRPEYFTTLGFSPRRLAGGLLAAALVGVAPAVSALAFAALVVYGARLSPGAALLALPAAALGLVTAVLLSLLAVDLFGLLLRSRAGAVLAGLVGGTLLALTAQGWWLAVPLGGGDDRSWATTPARALPPGWGVAAVDAAGRADWPAAAGLLVAQGALLGGLLAGWAALLARRVSAARGAVLALPWRDWWPRRGWGGWGPRPGSRAGQRVVPGGRAGVVVAKELRSWSRDLVRIDFLTFALVYSLVVCALPLAAGWTGMLPWAGPITVAMAAAVSANLYGADGTALWLTLMTPGAARADVRGRQLAWLLVVAPLATLVAVVTTSLSGQGGAWPWVLALLPALLGGGAGLVVLVAVVGLTPGIDPPKRGANPLSFGEDPGAQAGQGMLTLVLVALTALPAGAVVLAGTWSERPLLAWAGVPTGLLTGGLLAWGLGHLAHRRLRARGPELLALMRYGPTPDASPARPGQPQLPPLPLVQTIIVYLCWSLAWLPLLPQGLVAAVFKLVGSPVRSWFLALYLPPAWQWPVILGMIALGLAMVAIAVEIPRRHRRRHTIPG